MENRGHRPSVLSSRHSGMKLTRSQHANQVERGLDKGTVFDARTATYVDAEYF